MVSFLFLLKDDEFKDIRSCIYWINIALISLFLGCIYFFLPYKSLYILVALILVAIFYTAIVGNFILALMKLVIRSEEKYHNKTKVKEEKPIQDTAPKFFNFLEVEAEETKVEDAKEIPIVITKKETAKKKASVTKKKTTTPKKKATTKKKSVTKKATTSSTAKKTSTTKAKTSAKAKTSTTIKKKTTPKKNTSTKKKSTPKNPTTKKKTASKKVTTKKKTNSSKKKTNKSTK